MKYIYTITLLSLALILTGCSNDKQVETRDNTAAIKVTVNELVSNNNNPFLAVSGKIQSVNSADLSTRIMGYVTNIVLSILLETLHGFHLGTRILNPFSDIVFDTF